MLAILVQVLGLSPSQASTVAVLPSDSVGIDFVSAPGTTFPNQSQRYAAANEAGAGWDRWVIYWNSIETSPGQYDWSGVYQVLAGDLAHNLNVDAILLGTPTFYATSSTATAQSPSVAAPFGGLHPLVSSATTVPQGLDQPTFQDGTDNWMPGKAINPQNHWAVFVNKAVSLYRGQIHYWEIWNEPDFSDFWSGTLDQYVRLLKVAYLAAHAADYTATVKIMVGGMMYWQWANAYGDQAWLRQFVADVATDPSAPANGYYFDVIPWHWYSRSSDVYWHTLSAENILASAGITGKEIWVNETNVRACNEPMVPDYVNCNDYPGGTNPNGNWAVGSATLDEQASYIIQAIAYGFAAGANRIFEFQLQDDGNVDAYGMFRNDGSVRPIYQAYALAAQNLEGFATVRRYTKNGAEWITFGVPGPNPHRTTVLWNDTGKQVGALVQPGGSLATSVSLIQQNGTRQSITPAATYCVPLAPATDNRNYDSPWNPDDYIIGGPTVFLVENLPSDTTPPASRVAIPAGENSQTPFTVSWGGDDSNGWGIFDYTVQFRDLTSGGYWTNWLTNTTATSGSFTPTPGHTYVFRSLAEDWAGNVESKQANQSDVTIGTKGVSGESTQSPHVLYFPLVGNANPPGC